MLAGWVDLDQREDAGDIGPSHPILIDPEYRLDPLLAGSWADRGSRGWLKGWDRRRTTGCSSRSLRQRGRYWHEAGSGDLLDWEAWRRHGQQSGRGIGGSKWQRELAALRLVYEWAEKEGTCVART